MSSITSTSQYYNQLFKQNTSSTGDSLSDILTQASKTAASSTLTASDTVSLSPEAQALLDKLEQKTSADDQTASSNEKFILTKAQQAKLNEILAKYKDEPFTEGTFLKIKAELEQAGIAPDQLAAKEQVRNINPTNTLLNILSGNDTNFSVTEQNQASQEAIKKKSEAYLEDIISAWQSVSTTVGVEE